MVPYVLIRCRTNRNLHLDTHTRRMRMIAMCVMALLPVSAAWIASGQPFSLSLRTICSPVQMSSAYPPENDGEGSKPESGVDWDSAWSAELARRRAGTSEWRPEGREPVTTERMLEVKAKRAVSYSQSALRACNPCSSNTEGMHLRRRTTFPYRFNRPQPTGAFGSG